LTPEDHTIPSFFEDIRPRMSWVRFLKEKHNSRIKDHPFINFALQNSNPSKHYWLIPNDVLLTLLMKNSFSYCWMEKTIISAIRQKKNKNKNNLKVKGNLTEYQESKLWYQLMRKYTGNHFFIFNLAREKDIDVTLKKDEKVSDKSWAWSLQVTLIRSYLSSYKSGLHKVLTQKKLNFLS